MSSLSASSRERSHQGHTLNSSSSDTHAAPIGIAWTHSFKNGLFDISNIDFTRPMLDKAGIERLIPHRGDMSLMDAIVWHSPDCKLGLALKHVKESEFWVQGHFPGRPLLPGVLQVEAGAQLAAFLYNARQTEPLVPAFTRIENCSFRSMVKPGDDLYLLCREVKWSRRGFTCDVQGVVEGKLTFEARVQGLVI